MPNASSLNSCLLITHAASEVGSELIRFLLRETSCSVVAIDSLHATSLELSTLLSHDRQQSHRIDRLSGLLGQRRVAFLQGSVANAAWIARLFRDFPIAAVIDLQPRWNRAFEASAHAIALQTPFTADSLPIFAPRSPKPSTAAIAKRHGVMSRSMPATALESPLREPIVSAWRSHARGCSQGIWIQVSQQSGRWTEPLWQISPDTQHERQLEVGATDSARLDSSSLIAATQLCQQVNLLLHSFGRHALTDLGDERWNASLELLNLSSS